MTNTSLTRVLKHRVDSIGMNYDTLLHAQELVVFGSYAAGVSDPESDIDVLAVGPRYRVARSGLDLISVSPEHIMSAEWLGSELASHIAAYGVWIYGEGRWKKMAALSKRAEMAKARRIERLVNGLEKAWYRLHPVFHYRYRLSVRREVQRLDLLRQQIAIPPGAILDSYWRNDAAYHQQIVEISKSLNITSRVLNFVLERIFLLQNEQKLKESK